jgi:choline dehydrogenase-like flavoprotein
LAPGLVAGTLAYKLAPSGKKILLLERGGYLPREKENWNSRRVFTENRHKAKETWRDRYRNTFQQVDPAAVGPMPVSAGVSDRKEIAAVMP